MFVLGLVLISLLLFVWLCVCFYAFGFVLLSLLVDVLLLLCNLLFVCSFACRGLCLVRVFVCSLCVLFVLWLFVVICVLLFV